LAFAETGDFYISTLHANNSNQALDRIINFFPEEHRSQLLQDLSTNLRTFVCQRLVQILKGIGYILAGMSFLFLGIHYMKE